MITTEVEIVLAAVEVTDDYTVALTVTDPLTHTDATIALTPVQTQALVDELLAAASGAVSAYWEDRGATPTASFAFDVDLVICRDCTEGKHGACIGSAHVERGDEIDEVACQCTAEGHRGRS